MPKITVLPHATICPQGATFEVKPGVKLARALLTNGIKIEHACEFSGACSTCHVIVREGYDSLNEPEDEELDMLDQAWGVTSVSRLSCQTVVGTEDLTVEIPKYSRNHAKEL